MVMNRLLPEGSVVGSWNAGIIGYFSRFSMVNLDGLINSYDYLRANKEEHHIHISHAVRSQPYGRYRSRIRPRAPGDAVRERAVGCGLVEA